MHTCGTSFGLNITTCCEWRGGGREEGASSEAGESSVSQKTKKTRERKDICMSAVSIINS